MSGGKKRSQTSQLESKVLSEEEKNIYMSKMVEYIQIRKNL